jgi:hypothetical protein
MVVIDGTFTTIIQTQSLTYNIAWTWQPSSQFGGHLHATFPDPIIAVPELAIATMSGRCMAEQIRLRSTVLTGIANGTFDRANGKVCTKATVQCNGVDVLVDLCVGFFDTPIQPLVGLAPGAFDGMVCTDNQTCGYLPPCGGLGDDACVPATILDCYVNQCDTIAKRCVHVPRTIGQRECAMLSPEGEITGIGHCENWACVTGPYI